MRSSLFPAGLYPGEAKTEQGNELARRAIASVRLLVEELGGQGTVEQPAGSYMLKFWEHENLLEGLEMSSATLHQCRYGRPFKKPTVFHQFGGLQLGTLSRTCGSGAGSCGREVHVQLGLGHEPTHRAAEYPPGLVAAYAAGLRKVIVDRAIKEDTSRDRLALAQKGKVKRHIDRGETAESKRERRAREDA